MFLWAHRTTELGRPCITPFSSLLEGALYSIVDVGVGCEQSFFFFPFKQKTLENSANGFLYFLHSLILISFLYYLPLLYDIRITRVGVSAMSLAFSF